MAKRIGTAARYAMAALAVSTVGAFADVNYDEAEVVDVEPIVEQVEIVEPKERCWFETVQRRQRGERSITAPLLGAIIGGAVGNAVGHKKRNKQVGAVVGAVLGGSLARDLSRDAHAPVRRVRREVCDVVEQRKTQERVTGYMVTYRYQGETHRARMEQRPGERIRVRVRVAPA